MTENYSDLANLFAKNFKTKYKELINRNSKRLSLCDEKTLEQVRIELLDSEYRFLFSSFGTKKYARELFEEYNIQGKKYPKANFLQKLQFAKEKMVEFGMSERDRIIEWTNRPDEELVKDMAEYAAWLAVMKYRIDEADVVLDDDGILENKSDPSRKESSELEKSRKTKSIDLSSMRLKWNEEDIEVLKGLFQQLTNEEDSYIDTTDYLFFENHFTGKKEKNKIVWLKSLGSLIYLLDNLSNYLDKVLFVSNKKRKKIKHFIGNHFVYINNEKVREIYSKSISDARSKFTDSRKNSRIDKELIKKIDAIIQSLSNI
ncbi:MAG TPA: hypothetical protein PK563_14745 [Tenuifilaceae bacterium]|nr:hypothetical protein [Tenuifilaceae bacterium]